MDDKKIELKLEGTILHVDLGFELTVANSDALKNMLIPYKGQDISEIVFDTTNLVFLSSSGIRTIYFAQQELGHKPKIVFVNCAKEIYDTLQITGISHFISFVDDERKNGQLDKMPSGRKSTRRLDRSNSNSIPPITTWWFIK